MTGYDHLLADTIGFTAARNMGEHARNVVVSPVLDVRIPHVRRYVTGGSRGGDSFIGQLLLATRPEAEHVVVVPADHSQIDPWWERAIAQGKAVTVLQMPPDTTYADRNAAIIYESDALAGFPSYPENDSRSQRSGTWQTIRMAERAGTLSQWHCTEPPYAGRIEKYIEDRRLV
jgi:hypothetical protein